MNYYTSRTKQFLAVQSIGCSSPRSQATYGWTLQTIYHFFFFPFPSSLFALPCVGFRGVSYLVLGLVWCWCW
jgi:hypothetical protein